MNRGPIVSAFAIGLVACTAGNASNDETNTGDEDGNSAEDGGATDGSGDDDSGDDDSGDDDSDVPPGALGDPLVQLSSVQPMPGPHFLQSRVLGDTWWVCTGRQGLIAYDISAPESLSELGKTNFTLGGRCQYIAIDETASVGYVTSSAEQTNPQPLIAAIDLSNPSGPRELWALARDEQPAGLDHEDNLLAVAAKSAGLLLFDVSGSMPTELGVVSTGDAWNVRLRDGIGYVADGTAGLLVVDLADASSPTLLGSVDLDGISKDLVLVDDVAYVALGGNGLATVDISDTSAPSLLDHDVTPGSSLALAASPELGGLFVADWNDIRLFDISDRSDPYALGREPLPFRMGRDARTMGMAAKGDLVLSSNWDEAAIYRFMPGVNAPDLVLSPLELQLPGAGSGDSSTAVLLLENAGPRSLDDLAVSAPSNVVAVGLPDSIAPFETKAVEIGFTAQDDQPFSANVAFASNDIDQPTQDLGVTANLMGLGVGDPVPDMSWVDLDSNPVALADFPDQVVLLAYFATF